MKNVPASQMLSPLDRGREETRSLLIEVAEDLFGRFGVDGVSMREIGRASGSRNSSIISYYFGTKELLIESIIDYRMPTIEIRRSELMRQADADGKCSDLRTLLHAQWMPVFEQRNRHGKHSFARFLGNLSRSKWIRVRSDMSPHFPATGRIVDRLQEVMNAEDMDTSGIRLRLCAFLVMGSIELIDLLDDVPVNDEMAVSLFNDAVDMAARSLLVDS